MTLREAEKLYIVLKEEKDMHSFSPHGDFRNWLLGPRGDLYRVVCVCRSEYRRDYKRAKFAHPSLTEDEFKKRKKDYQRKLLKLRRL